MIHNCGIVLWNLIKYSLMTVIIVWAAKCHSIQVEFYDGKNFEGFFYEANSDVSCTNLPPRQRNQVSSIKTDQCLIVYSNLDCSNENPLARSIKIPAGDHPDLSLFKQQVSNFDNTVDSFHACKETLGGERIQVTLKSGLGTGPLNESLAEYRDLCGCTNLPEFAQGQVNGLDNHGGCVSLYADLNCTGDMRVVSGHSPESVNLINIGFAGKAKSIKQCEDSFPCLRINATIFKILLSTNSLGTWENSSFVKMELGSPAIFRNHGKGVSKKDYEAEKNIHEFFEVWRPEGMLRMNKVETSKNVLVELETNFPTFATSKIVGALTAALNFESLPSSPASEIFWKEEITKFKVDEDIEIPACSTIKVSSYVRFVQQFSIAYKLHVLMRGKMGFRRMTSDELKQKLLGINYVKDFDQDGIIAKASGRILADLGTDTNVIADSVRIKGCPAA